MAEALPPYRHRRAVHRFLDRHRRPLTALLAACALLSAVLVLRPPPEPGREVLVAARDLDASSPLGEADLAPRRVPESVLPEGAMATHTDTSGRRLSGPVREGEVLTDARLADPPARPYGPGLVAAPVRVADAGSVSLITPGDRVDVLAASGSDDPTVAHSGPAVEVVSDRPVLAVPDDDSRGGEGGALLVVAADPEEARSLAGAAADSRLSVSIRN
ncbi:Flp pilus assembly protein CpaB [Nocardiopsis salina]|uniref:Flp pilus assembly protein CpaB n=1 Tax=Nocardiopsis salina TaxID=245836 RepID=UPI000475E974|nr:Flp pilus assembly protein CpaB [Nocardiopsis salina]